MRFHFSTLVAIAAVLPCALGQTAYTAEGVFNAARVCQASQGSVSESLDIIVNNNFANKDTQQTFSGLQGWNAQTGLLGQVGSQVLQAVILGAQKHEADITLNVVNSGGSSQPVTLAGQSDLTLSYTTADTTYVTLTANAAGSTRFYAGRASFPFLQGTSPSLGPASSGTFVLDHNQNQFDDAAAQVQGYRGDSYAPYATPTPVLSAVRTSNIAAFLNAYNVYGQTSTLASGNVAVTNTPTDAKVYQRVTVTYCYSYTLPGGTGDPQFTGFQGQQFQIHGIPDEHFAIISTPKYYMNARFAYLANGFCNYNDTECFTHPGTYMSVLYFGMPDVALKIVSGPHHSGFEKVTYNDRPLRVGDHIRLPLSNSSCITLLSDRRLTIKLDEITLRIANSDNFLNYQAELNDAQLLLQGSRRVVIAEHDHVAVSTALHRHYPSYPMHGLLGQTWRNVQYADKKLYQGEVIDYQVAGLTKPEFRYSQYQA